MADLPVFPIQAPFEFDQNTPVRRRSTNTKTYNVLLCMSELMAQKYPFLNAFNILTMLGDMF